MAQQKSDVNYIYFDLNTPVLNNNATRTIDGLLGSKKVKPNQRILLFGYADYLGTREHNDSLSTARAMYVRSYLIIKGIPEGNILVCVGKGAIERTPKAGGYAQDRKVEIITDANYIKTHTCEPLTKCNIEELKKVATTNGIYQAFGPSQIKVQDETVIIRLPNGDEYKGILNKDGQKIDNGIYIWANGEKYVGGFSNDKKEGRGTYTFVNGDVFDGEWKNDKVITGKFMGGKIATLEKCKLFEAQKRYTCRIPRVSMYDENLLHNENVLKLQNGDYYIGELTKEGQKISGGTYMWANGEKYIGDYNNDKKSGKGKYIWPNGDIFEGSWINDTPTEGVLNFIGTDVNAGTKLIFYGMIKDGNAPCGYNLIRWDKCNLQKNQLPNDTKFAITDVEKFDSTYYIIFANDNPLCWTNDSEMTFKYELSGKFENSKLIGLGREQKISWQVPELIFTYNGNFENNLKNGEGDLRHRYKERIYYKYTGGWKNNQQNGYGTDTLNGEGWIGTYKNGFVDGKCLFHFGGTADNSTNYDFSGIMNCGLKDGYGEESISYNGSGLGYSDDFTTYVSYKGSFKQNKRNGHGKIVYKDGRVYEGDWKDDKKNGFGKFYDENGVLLQEGKWENGAFMGK